MPEELRCRHPAIAESGTYNTHLDCPQEDKVEFDRARLQDLVGAIRAATEELRRDPEAALPAAFVTFHTRAAQVRSFSSA
jgi:hypothetical protein